MDPQIPPHGLIFSTTLCNNPLQRLCWLHLLKVTKRPLKMSSVNPFLVTPWTVIKYVTLRASSYVPLRTLNLIKLSPVTSFLASTVLFLERCPSHMLPANLGLHTRRAF